MYIYSNLTEGASNSAFLEGTAGWTVIKKTANTDRVSTTTLAADPDFTFTVNANTKYVFRAQIFYDCNATADMKFGHTCVTSPDFYMCSRRGKIPGATSYTAITNDRANNTSGIALSGTGTNGGIIEINGIIHAGASGGSWAFTWAQRISTAANSTILAGSYLEYRVV